tara:strand:+ start:252 stop:491 length:240 start_codon:yes stop_codon:yes gene_type:complete
MTIKTQILCKEQTEHDSTPREYWEKFEFDIRSYVAHSEHDLGSVLYLSGLLVSVVIKLSFEELSEKLQIFNSFETIGLN